jgi:signal peptidase I
VQLTDQPDKQAEQHAEAQAEAQRRDETPFEALAGYCMVLVVGLFVYTFIGQNFLIPSGSMKDTLLVGDHLLVDRITTAPPAAWMPLVHYREPRRGDITVFYKPVADLDKDGNPDYPFLVKRLIGVPGDRIHLQDGIVILNGVAQSPPPDGQQTPVFGEWKEFLDEFPSRTPVPEPGSYITEAWAVEFASHVVNGELVVPPGMYFMMGDNRHNSADSRFWGFVPRENIVGRPLVNYWSFKTPDDEENKTSMADNLSWMVHVGTHFLSDTRWKRTFHVTR